MFLHDAEAIHQYLFRRDIFTRLEGNDFVRALPVNKGPLGSEALRHGTVHRARNNPDRAVGRLGRQALPKPAIYNDRDSFHRQFALRVTGARPGLRRHWTSQANERWYSSWSFGDHCVRRGCS